jgi:uncharacterized membrane protein
LEDFDVMNELSATENVVSAERPGGLAAIHRLLAERSFYPLLLCTLFGFAFLLARAYVLRQVGYGFLIKNLFLAWIPYVMSLAALWLARPESKQAGPRRKWTIAGVWAAWLAMLPNAPYIFTDLIHWRHRQEMSWWFDLGLVLMFALAGCFCGIASLRIMHDLVRRSRGEIVGWLFVLVVSALTGFGIYLGRFERWNSWDVLTRPRFIAGQLLSGLADPLSHSRTLGVTMMFGAMTLACYVMVVSMQHAPSKRAE